jgi:hypothetical protein
VLADFYNISGAKDTKIFTSQEKARAVSGLELMATLPQISLDKLNSSLTTIDRKPILILCDGKIIDEVDLTGIKPEEILKTEYFSQPPARYRNLGVNAVLVVYTKEKLVQGGYVLANLKNSFTTGYGTEIVQGKYHSGDNDFSLRYFVDYRDLNKQHFEQKYAANLSDGLYNVNRKAENGDYAGAYHTINATFANTKGESQMFSAKARVAINPGMERDRQTISGIRHDIPFDNEHSETYTHTNYFSPSLDLYFSKKLKNNQELSANVVNTYYNIKSKRNFLQTNAAGNILKYDTEINNKSYSVISEINYSKDFEKTGFNFGVRQYFKNLDEKFIHENDKSLNFSTINNLYYYGEFWTEVGKLYFQAGVGGDNSWLNIAENSQKNYFVLRPSLVVSYNFSDNSALQFVSQTASNIPEMSMLSQSPAMLDTAFFSKGNGSLQPYTMFANSLFYILSGQKYYFRTTLNHFIAKNPYYTTIYNRSDYIEKTISNIDQMQSVKYDLLLNWQPVQQISLKGYYGVEYQYFKAFDKKYFHWFNFGNISAQFYYKRLTLNIQAIMQGKSLEANLYRKLLDLYQADLTWKKKSFSATLACRFSHRPETIETVDNQPVYYKESRAWGNFNGLCYLQLVYVFDFGKKVERNVNQKLNNNDSDIGIRKDNRAEQ